MIEEKLCPRCNSVLGLRPVSSLFDPTGEKYGVYLACKSCGWYCMNRFYDVPKKKLEVDRVDKINGGITK